MTKTTSWRLSKMSIFSTRLCSKMNKLALNSIPSLFIALFSKDSTDSLQLKHLYFVLSSKASQYMRFISQKHLLKSWRKIRMQFIKTKKGRFMAFTTRVTPIMTNNTYSSWQIFSPNWKSGSSFQMCTWLMSWKPVQKSYLSTKATTDMGLTLTTRSIWSWHLDHRPVSAFTTCFTRSGMNSLSRRWLTSSASRLGVNPCMTSWNRVPGSGTSFWWKRWQNTPGMSTFHTKALKRDVIEMFGECRNYDQVICQSDTSNKSLIANLNKLNIELFANIEFQQHTKNCITEIRKLPAKLFDMESVGLRISFKTHNLLQLFLKKYLHNLNKVKAKCLRKMKTLDGDLSFRFCDFSPMSKRAIRKIDVKYKDQIFENKFWMQELAQNDLNQYPHTREKFEL